MTGYSQNTVDTTGTATQQNDQAFTGRVGLNYLLAPGLVPYASYATTFAPQPGTDASVAPSGRRPAIRSRRASST